MKRILALLSAFMIFVNLFPYQIFSAWEIDNYYQWLSTDVSSSFLNPEQNLNVNPDQEFRLETYMWNKSWWALNNISYYTNFPNWIVYNTTTTAWNFADFALVWIIPTTSFYPNSIPNYLNGYSWLANDKIYQMRRILLKFPSTWSVYENNLSTYFTANWSSAFTSNTQTSIVRVNVKPHITDY